MQRTLTNINANTQELEIILDESEYQEYYKSSYEKIKNKLSIPGFRKGKIPYNIAIKQFGKTIEAEAIEIAAQEEFSKAVEEEAINLIDRPNLKDIQKNPGEIKFVFEYQIYPKIELKDYKGITIQEPVHLVTEDEINSEITNILNKQGDIIDAEVIEDENFVVGVSIIEVDKDTKEPLEGAKSQENNYYLNDNSLDKNLVDALLTHKQNDVVFYSFDHEGGHEGEHNHDFDGHHEHHFQITINAVQKIIPKELNDEFVAEFTGGKFETVSDFHDEVEFQLQEKWDQESRKIVEDQIIHKLISENDIEVPQAFMENSLTQMVRNFKSQFGNNPAFKNTDDTAIRNEFIPIAERNVKWELIRNRIIEIENLEIEDFDIENLANKEAEKTGQSPDQIKQIIENNEQVKLTILAKKVIDFVLDFAITEEVSFEDLENE